MNANMTPCKIDPGWARRWTGQAWDLWTRSISVTATILAVLVVCDFGMPHLTILPMLVIVPVSAFLFTLLRSLDHGGGVQVWSAAWELLRGCLRDLWHFTLQLCLWMFLMTVVMLVVSLALQGGKTTSSLHGAAALLSHSLQLVPAFLQNGFLNGIGWFALLASPMSGPILYLTLAVGNQLSFHLYNAYQGLFKNMPVFIAGVILTFFSRPVIESLVIWMANHVSPLFAAWIGNLLAALLILIIASYAYLFSREMFEGTKTNAPRRVAVKQGAFARSNIWSQQTRYQPSNPELAVVLLIVENPKT